MDRVTQLKQALPYIQRYRGNAFVVHLENEALGNNHALQSLSEDIALLQGVGIDVVVAHGSDTASSNALVALLRGCGAQAVGLAGSDAALVELGDKGQLLKVNPEALSALTGAGFIPVVNVAQDSEVLAGHIACALKADKLFFLAKQAGLLEEASNPETLISYCDVATIKTLTAVASAEVLPQLNATLHALEVGVGRVHIISAWQPSALLLEVFTNEGCGTLVVTDTTKVAQ